jgi:anti-sigma factor (TIGR02949 family)
MSESTNMQCEDALRLLAQYLDRELSDGEHADVEQHLRTCRSCFSRAEFERRLKGELAALSTADVPTALHDRIRALLDSTR